MQCIFKRKVRRQMARVHESVPGPAALGPAVLNHKALSISDTLPTHLSLDRSPSHFHPHFTPYSAFRSTQCCFQDLSLPVANLVLKQFPASLLCLPLVLIVNVAGTAISFHSYFLLPRILGLHSCYGLWRCILNMGSGFFILWALCVESRYSFRIRTLTFSSWLAFWMLILG